MKIELYHASPEILTEITNDGIFGGIFASSDHQVALSHHNNLHKITLDESEILTQYVLEYETDYETVKKIITEAINTVDEDEFNEIFELITEDKSAHRSEISEDRLLEIFCCDDLGEASWDCQRIRGVIAKKLGYKAVEMRDEHGTTYLVLASAKIQSI